MDEDAEGAPVVTRLGYSKNDAWRNFGVKIDGNYSDFSYLNITMRAETRGLTPGAVNVNMKIVNPIPEKDGVLTQEAAERIVSEQGFCVKNTRALESFSHDFSHYRLILHPIAVRVNKKPLTSNSERWIKLADLPDIGLPAPIRSLLEKFFL